MSPPNRRTQVGDSSKGSLAALALISLVCLTGSSVRQTTVAEMVEHSEFVFEGRVTKIEARDDADGRRIHTYVLFEILDVIKGPSQGASLELRFLGGTVGERTLSVTDMRLPGLGEHGIYFVESLSRNQVHPLFGWSQGHLLVLTDGDEQKRVFSFDRLPVVAVEPAPRGSARGVGVGVARGLVLGERARLETAITLGQFKAHLRKLQASAAP